MAETTTIRIRRETRDQIRQLAELRGVFDRGADPREIEHEDRVLGAADLAAQHRGLGPLPLRPWSTRDCGSPLHVEASPPEGCLRARSFALVEVRSLDRSLLIERWVC